MALNTTSIASDRVTRGTRKSSRSSSRGRGRRRVQCRRVNDFAGIRIQLDSMIVVQGVFGIREGHVRHSLDEVFHFILLPSNGFSFLQSLQSSPSILGRQERTDWIRPRVKVRRGSIIFLLDTKEI